LRLARLYCGKRGAFERWWSRGLPPILEAGEQQVEQREDLTPEPLLVCL
jgi:hypothetical protein